MSQLHHTDGDLVLLTGSPSDSASGDPYSGIEESGRQFFYNDMYKKDRQIVLLAHRVTIRGEGHFAVTKKGEYRHFSSKELKGEYRHFSSLELEDGQLFSYMFSKSDEFRKKMWDASHYEVD